MSQEREKLRLCTSFEELRAGMLVRVDCTGCGGRHRSWLKERGTKTGIYVGTGAPPGTTETDYWLYWEENACGRTGLGRVAVRNRHVRIIDTGNDDEAERNEGRELSKVTSTLIRAGWKAGA